MAKEVRCPNCKKKICEIVGLATISSICPRCKSAFSTTVHTAPTFQKRNGTVQK